MGHDGDKEAGAGQEEKVINERRRQEALQKYAVLRDQNFPLVPEISSEELLRLFDADAIGDSVILVDCRSELERKISTYKGAIPLVKFEANVHDYKDKQIVAYCAIGRRSGLFARDFLAKYPEIKVRNHAGSLVDWTHVGGPLVDEATGSPTLQVHPGSGWTQYLPVGEGLEVHGA